ncbi:N-acetylgalactosamine kinase [Myotis davidii]|uniref:N-acetylgalactosamine kinase n=1 Tax=Myotis davidii TaxID=225400 RepID=L5MBU3_MYODS|nr:N-acetylgalactosamine kinase [Myotis davidii]
MHIGPDTQLPSDPTQNPATDCDIQELFSASNIQTQTEESECSTVTTKPVLESLDKEIQTETLDTEAQHDFCGGNSNFLGLECLIRRWTEVSFFLDSSPHCPVELAEICAKSERYIGTEGGGMDQSISFLAEEGTAKLIEFSPLRATDVKLPSGAVFVIANSCVEMNKAATSHFNIRVMECRLAAKLLAKYKSLQWDKVLRLEEVQTKLGVSLEEMLLIIEDALHPEPYSPEEVCRCLGISLQELQTQILSPNTQDVLVFKLYQRAKHVYSEAARVLQFKKICEEAPDNMVQLLGELMNQSHESCRDMYECSCPELDQLVDICRTFGAQGSRLTGAGWGGCTVSLVPADKLPSFLANVQEAYYRSGDRCLAPEKQSLFATKPGGGALVFLEA